MIGFFNSSGSFSLAAINALQDDANSLYIQGVPEPSLSGIFSIDFSVHPVGNYTEVMQEADFMNYEGEYLHYNNHDGTSMIGGTKTTARANIVDDGTENVLDILYEAGGYGLSGGGLFLMNALPKVGRPAEDVNSPTEITLEYYVKFVGGTFDWGLGGKLPGLAGGVAPTEAVDGDKYNVLNGFSARHMWEDLWGISGNPSGMKTYTYNVQLNAGDSGKGPWFNPVTVPTDMFYYNDADTDSFQPTTDVWYKITQKVRANTPGNSDGTMKSYIDDVLMNDLVGLKLIADGYNGDYTVDRLCFSTFYGGGSVAWAPAVDTHIRFKDFKVFEDTAFNENITTFNHPAIYYTSDELLAVRDVISDPLYDKVTTSNLARTYPDPPTAPFECGSYNSGDEDECNDCSFEMRTARYYALRANAEQNAALAQKAVDFIDAWAYAWTVQGYTMSGSNEPLIKAWVLNELPLAIELLVHNDYGFVYPATELARAEDYLDAIYGNGYPAQCNLGANWTIASITGYQNYWICKHGLTSNEAEKTTAVENYKFYAGFNDMMIRTYIFMNSDAGGIPEIIDFENESGGDLVCYVQTWADTDYILSEGIWYVWNSNTSPGTFNDPDAFKDDGLFSEYWRDIPHASMSSHFLIMAFETARINGYKDYYAQYKTRLSAGLENMYAACNKKHIGTGYYLTVDPLSYATAVQGKTVPIVSTSDVNGYNYRSESNYNAGLYKYGKANGWALPQMYENYDILGFPEIMDSSKSVFDYIFKGIET